MARERASGHSWQESWAGGGRGISERNGGIGVTRGRLVEAAQRLVVIGAGFGNIIGGRRRTLGIDTASSRVFHLYRIQIFPPAIRLMSWSLMLLSDVAELCRANSQCHDHIKACTNIFGHVYLSEPIPAMDLHCSSRNRSYYSSSQH
jgi:hypothetical protein